ncbi:YfiR family protein [Undibacterium sp. Jales W-56]|uniref:YfiR family protein n=1 Tax=Undibacterium sp. Jales W-56 TaxID=2897325 RepID=UPI0021CE3B77|nr:YfiR family protein [Undibacterium sp. Jales W-56]MCU6434965.1 YfiR family protein [Undibacterium sp. Jales W-56]
MRFNLRRQFFTTIFFALLLPALTASLVLAEEIADAPEYALKAVYLNNFALFTEWPDETNEVLEFCVFGKDPFGRFLENAAQKKIRGKAIHLRRAVQGADLKSCHLLFIPALEKENFSRIAPSISQQAILTVTETAQVGEKYPNVMIVIVQEGSNVMFDVNQSVAKTAGLSFSSKLLRLARNVK